MAATGIDIRDLRFRYPAYPGLPSRPLLDGLRLEVPSGGVAVVLGGSDEGKTTLARVLGALVPRFSGGEVAGSVTVGGVDVLAAAPYDLLASVGLVFQHTDEQIATTRCDAEVALGLESLGVEPAAMRRRVDGALDAFGLAGYAARNPATLSGGEKKRLLLACLEALDPSAWVLDEAFEELDPAWRRVTLERLRGRGRTVLVLDSRWSPLFGARADRFAVLAGGAARGVSARHDDHALRAALEAAGLLPDAAAGPRTTGSAAATGAQRRPFLRARGLSFAYPSGGFGLSIGRLELERGAVTALVGANGSGKSTLARLLCGLLAPEAGVVEVDRGGGFAPATPAELNRSVGYLFQDPDRQIFAPTVGDELRAAAGPGGAGRAGEARERFGLPPAGAPTALLSHGARRRLQAATAWLLGRPLLILDEADAGLSYRAFAGLLDAVRESGAGLVLVTHDAALARAAADRVVALEAGRVVAEARVDDAGGPEAALAAGGLGGSA